MINMMLRSARLFHPAMTATILTDEYTDLTGITVPMRRVEGPIEHTRLMYERTRAQLNHVLTSDFAVPLVLLDTDILINASLTNLVQLPFDVALTWRQNPKMAINGGFLVLNNQRPKAVKAFFERFASIYQQSYSDQSAWFGDQLALQECIGLSPEAIARQEFVDVDGCRIMLLPCDTYNFSPKNRFREIVKPFEGKVVLHFKGERKRLMSWYWNAHLARHASWWPVSWLRPWFVKLQLAMLRYIEISRKTT